MDIAKQNLDAATAYLAKIRKSATASRRALVLTTGTTLATLLALIWAINDYRSYLALGRGGPPYNVFGWAYIHLGLGPFTISEKDKFSTADYPSQGAHPEVIALPKRKGGPATARGIAPHRQQTQFASQDMQEKIWSLFTTLATSYPQLLHIKHSLYERLHLGLFLTDSHLTNSSLLVPPTAQLSRGEISHMHGDLSVHLYLSPADAKLAIEKGWAERHRLARENPVWGTGGWRPFAIGQTYLLFYGPRNAEEVEVFKVWLECGVKFMSGREDIVIQQ